MNHDKKAASKYDYVCQAPNYRYKWEMSKK